MFKTDTMLEVPHTANIRKRRSKLSGTARLTGSQIAALPEVPPSSKSVLDSEARGGCGDAVLDLESVAELEEPSFHFHTRGQALPIE